MTDPTGPVAVVFDVEGEANADYFPTREAAARAILWRSFVNPQIVPTVTAGDSVGRTLLIRAGELFTVSRIGQDPEFPDLIILIGHSFTDAPELAGDRSIDRPDSTWSTKRSMAYADMTVHIDPTDTAAMVRAFTEGTP